jgi:hypothetical protein
VPRAVVSPWSALILAQNNIFVWTILDILWNKFFELLVLFVAIKYRQRRSFSAVIKNAAI